MCFGSGTTKLCSIKGGNSEKKDGYFQKLAWDQVDVDTGDGVWDLPKSIDKKWRSIKIEIQAGDIARATFECFDDDGNIIDTREVFLTRLEVDFLGFDRNEERIPCGLSGGGWGS
jgi:hypothetical protein